jgi:hypothetical protein
MSDLKIGILLDSVIVPRWQEEIIRYLTGQRFASIDLIILNNSRKSDARRNRFLYKTFRSVERSLFPNGNDCFERRDISSLVAGFSILKVDSVQRLYTDEIPAGIVDAVKQYNLDIILRFGFRVLKGNILAASRFGIWSLHHGDSAVNRGGPPAFWEVVHKEPVTGVTLQILSDALDGGRVLGKAFVKTDLSSFNRNQNLVFWAGVELLCSKLKEFSVTRQLPERNEKAIPSFYDHPLYRDPADLATVQISVSFFLDRLSSWLDKLFNSKQWRILYRFDKPGIAETALYRYHLLTPPVGTDWADPFVILKGDSYYVFIEERPSQREKAHISILQFDTAGKLLFARPEKVLEEGHHLSYPFVFSYDADHYMIPESGAAGKVCLYKSEEFPRKWALKKVLLEVELYDATLVQHEGRWYLFGTQKPFSGNSPHQYLFIYHTDNLLTGEWTAHPMNPLTRDVRGARPAGRIFESNGRLIRPSQIGAPRYGYGIRFQEIIVLSPERYEEQPLTDVLPKWRNDILATHTFNDEGGFTVLDGQFK